LGAVAKTPVLMCTGYWVAVVVRIAEMEVVVSSSAVLVGVGRWDVVPVQTVLADSLSKSGGSLNRIDGSCQ